MKGDAVLKKYEEQDYIYCTCWLRAHCEWVIFMSVLNGDWLRPKPQFKCVTNTDGEIFSYGSEVVLWEEKQ